MKRQTKYKMAILAGCCMAILAGCKNTSVKVEHNQRLVYGTVEKIVGNEIVLQRQYEKKAENDTGLEEGEEESGEVDVIAALQLPVGMPIHKEEEEISFKEIEEGDPLKILMEKDSTGIEVPVEAWVSELTEKEKNSLEAAEPTTAVSAPSSASASSEVEISNEAEAAESSASN